MNDNNSENESHDHDNDGYDHTDGPGKEMLNGMSSHGRHGLRNPSAKYAEAPRLGCPADVGRLQYTSVG